MKKKESDGLLEKDLPNDQLKIIYSYGTKLINAELDLDGKGNDWVELDQVFDVENESTTT